jgi:succinyl-CoA synthetase beta subunit
MPVEITELTFLEQLAERHRIPVPEYVSGDAPAKQLREALERWGGDAIIKPDVLAGKRGKSGAVKKVGEFIEAQRAIKQIGNMEINGKLPRGAYAVQVIPAEAEAYSAITYDSRSLSPMLTLSLKGGMDIETVDDGDKVSLAVDVFKGLDAYQASEMLEKLGCPKNAISKFSRALVTVWDLFISSGMRMCEINPWRITAGGDAVACDFKAVFDEANYKFKNLPLTLPDYPASTSSFAEEMTAWNEASHQGQAHVSDLGGDLILPILFGGGASTIVCETLENNGGSPIFLSDFGGNPPYERMYGTAKICFEHNLGNCKLLLILGGKANNTLIDVTFQAIGDALAAYFEEQGPVDVPVIVGRGGPHLVKGLTSLRNTLEQLELPYVIFGPDTPLTLVAEYAARIARVTGGNGGGK